MTEKSSLWTVPKNLSSNLDRDFYFGKVFLWVYCSHEYNNPKHSERWWKYRYSRYFREYLSRSHQIPLRIFWSFIRTHRRCYRVSDWYRLIGNCYTGRSLCTEASRWKPSIWTWENWADGMTRCFYSPDFCGYRDCSWCDRKYTKYWSSNTCYLDIMDTSRSSSFKMMIIYKRIFYWEITPKYGSYRWCFPSSLRCYHDGDCSDRYTPCDICWSSLDPCFWLGCSRCEYVYVLQYLSHRLACDAWTSGRISW